jgi:hypothetical protein
VLVPIVLLHALLLERLDRHDRERGDVPGWVLITLMTAGIVAIIWGFAQERLLAILTEALASVTPG